MLFELNNGYINLNNITRIESLQDIPIRVFNSISLKTYDWVRSLYKIYFTDSSEIVVEKEVMEEIIEKMNEK